jgi:molybdenum cofactor biosynthesis enzyme MoaA
LRCQVTAWLSWARVGAGILQPNVATGRGRVLPGSSLPLSGVHWVDDGGQLEATSVEEVYARSLACLGAQLQPYPALAPRSLSVLPIARACQAACRFCFSESSASLGQRARLADVALAERWMGPARAAGASRFVITGGGEPGLLTHASLVALMAAGARHFPKVVLISNGVHLARAGDAERAAMLEDYAGAGLSVLSVSRHHHDAAVNAAIMGLYTGTARLLATWREARAAGRLAGLRLRLVCVLQKGGVDSDAAIAAYLDWAARAGADEVCFKELYVSSTLESAYHDRPENAFSRAHQVPLARLTRALAALGYVQDGALPWGAPLYAGQAAGRPLRVAAYTEPSLYWERRHGIARSWNLMADGSCLASLEDPASTLALPGAPPPRRTIALVPQAGSRA